MQEHYRKLERMYLAAPCNSQFYENTRIKISHEKAEISCEVLPKHFHAAGAMHGSGYFRMLNDAAYFAVNSILTDSCVYTVSFNINLTRPVNQGWIKSIGQLKFKSNRLYIAEAVLYDDKDQVLSFGTGNFMNSGRPLNEKMGYA
ncbi:MAG: PaaI family thioesterase [Bacillota bacterium]|nr:PaaI family thioesterase [Bacillota bacterium]